MGKHRNVDNVVAAFAIDDVGATAIGERIAENVVIIVPGNVIGLRCAFDVLDIGECERAAVGFWPAPVERSTMSCCTGAVGKVEPPAVLKLNVSLPAPPS